MTTNYPEPKRNGSIQLREELLETWHQEERRQFEGWDFSAFKDRFWWTENQPWSYLGRASELMHTASAVVDLDTGGGERLLELRPHWPAKVCATEAYPPNFKLAVERLTPYAAHVFNVQSDERVTLPFADGEFDLVLNRHGGLNIPELARILAPGGTFYTQQVHAQNGWDLTAALGAQPEFLNGTPDYYVPLLQAAGFQVVHCQESHGKLHFADVGAIVFYLHAIPWMATGFTVDTHQDYLLALQDRVNAGAPLEFSTRSYVIEAHKA